MVIYDPDDPYADLYDVDDGKLCSMLKGVPNLITRCRHHRYQSHGLVSRKS